MQIFSFLYYFKLTLLFPPATYNPTPPAFLTPPSLSLSDSPPWCCMHFITFGSANLKKKRIYANAGLKNECSPPLQCAEESSEAPHYNIFSLLWIRGIIIKNDLWCWNEAEPLLPPGNLPNTLVTKHVDRHGASHNQQSDYKAIWQNHMRDRLTGCSTLSIVLHVLYCWLIHHIVNGWRKSHCDTGYKIWVKYTQYSHLKA